MKKSIKVLLSVLAAVCTIAVSSVMTTAAVLREFAVGGVYANASLSAYGGKTISSVSAATYVTHRANGVTTSGVVYAQLTYHECRESNPGMIKSGTTPLCNNTETTSSSKNKDAGYVFYSAESYHKLLAGSSMAEERLSEFYLN